MWNHSRTFIFFQWERMNSSSHIIEVEPSTGRIGVSHNLVSFQVIPIKVHLKFVNRISFFLGGRIHRFID